MSINFNSDGQGSTESRPTNRQRQQLIEERELLSDRLQAVENALAHVKTTIEAVKDVEFYRRQCRKAGVKV